MNLTPHVRDGYCAARFGFGTDHNPWRPGTVGWNAWDLGHKIGSLPRPLRWACGVILGVWP